MSRVTVAAPCHRIVPGGRGAPKLRAELEGPVHLHVLAASRSSIGLWSADCTHAGGEVYVSNEPDRERVRALIAELDKVRQESERLRAKIAEIRRQTPEYPSERDRSQFAETANRPPKRRS